MKDLLTVAEIRKLAKQLREAPQIDPTELMFKMADAADRFYSKYPCRAWEEAKKEAGKRHE